MGIILSIIVVAILLYWIFPFESLFFYLLHLYCKFKAEKSVITLRHSSLVAKTPARFTCSHVNALTMAHRRCHLFARKCLWHKWFKADYAPFRFFLFPNNRLFPNLFLTPGGRGNTELFFESFVKDMSIIVAHALGSFGHGRVCVF